MCIGVSLITCILTVCISLNIHTYAVGEPGIVLCRVSKQMLIHKLSPILILQIKRFHIGKHRVTKDSQPISFPRVLNMAPFCTSECVEVRIL